MGGGVEVLLVIGGYWCPVGRVESGGRSRRVVVIPSSIMVIGGMCICVTGEGYCMVGSVLTVICEV